MNNGQKQSENRVAGIAGDCGIDLLATTAKKVEQYAMAGPNSLANVIEAAGADFDVTTNGETAKIEVEKQSLQDQLSRQASRWNTANKARRQKPPKIATSRRNMGWGVVWLGATILLGILLLAGENYAGGVLILSLNAMGISDRLTAQFMLLSLSIFGCVIKMIASATGYETQQAANKFVFGMLIVLLIAYVTGFTLEVAKVAALSQLKIGAASIGALTEPTQGGAAYLMLGALLGGMAFSVYAIETFAETIVRSYDVLDTNPEHIDATNMMSATEISMVAIKGAIAQCDGKLSHHNAKRRQAISAATSYFFSLIGNRSIPLLIACLFIGSSLTGCSPASSPTSKQFEATIGNAASPPVANAKTKIQLAIAISDALPATSTTKLKASLPAVFERFAAEAEAGSKLTIFNAWTSEVIVSTVVSGSITRVRRAQLATSLGEVFSFLDRDDPRSKYDERANLPKLAQAIAQMRPVPQHVCILASPVLIIPSGPDAFWSMGGLEGRIPSDGLLFADPQYTIYSIIGRQPLAGLWHFGYDNDTELFVDDSARQATLRWWFLWLQLQGARLVTSQNSLEAALNGARDGLSDPLFTDVEADRSAAPAMLRVRKVTHELTKTHELNSTEKVLGDTEIGKVEESSKNKDPKTSKDDENATRRTEQPNAQASPKSAVKIPQMVADRGDTRSAGQIQKLVGRTKETRVLLCKFCGPAVADSGDLKATLVYNGYDVREMDYPLSTKIEEELNWADQGQVWFWSSADASKLNRRYVSEIGNRWKSGQLRGVMALCDGDPWTAEGNLLMKELAPTAKIFGSFPGKTVLKARTDGPGFLAEHALFARVQDLPEGETISSVESPELMPVCYSTEGRPIITVMERANSRLVCDCGFTRYFKRWQSSGSHTFAVNAAGWLAGFDRKVDQLTPK